MLHSVLRMQTPKQHDILANVIIDIFMKINAVKGCFILCPAWVMISCVRVVYDNCSKTTFVIKRLR
jgi:hypothetical protein